MEPYKPNKPWISVNLPSREQLIAMAMGLIPGGRALKNMYDNPEGPISETLDLAAEDLVPFYANLIKPAVKGEDIDLRNNLIEAALIGLPLNGTARRVNGQIPVDAVRTAEFNQRLSDALATQELPARTRNRLQAILDAGESPILERDNDWHHLNRAGLGDYHKDIIYRQPGRGAEIDPTESVSYRYTNKYYDAAVNNTPMTLEDRIYDELDRQMERLPYMTYEDAKSKYNQIVERIQRQDIAPTFEEYLAERYSPERYKININNSAFANTPRGWYIDNNGGYVPSYVGHPYKYTLNEKLNQTATQDIVNRDYIKQDLEGEVYGGWGEPSRPKAYDQELLDILKSDLPKEEKRLLIQGRYGDIILPIEIEELLL